MKKRELFALACLTPLLFVGCHQAAYQAPSSLGMPPTWHSTLAEGIQCEEIQNQSLPTNFSSSFLWWESLQDPLLNQLISQAATANKDLNLARWRLLESRLANQASLSSFYPRLDGSLTVGQAHYNPKKGTHLLNSKKQHRKAHKNVNFFEVGFDADWEIDLFGYRRHEYKASQASAEASEQEFYGVWVTLSAEIAKNYIQLRGAQLNLTLIEKNRGYAKDRAQLNQSLNQTGFTSLFDYTAAEEQMHILETKKIAFQLEIDQAHYRLAVLMGVMPGELDIDLKSTSSLPLLPDHKPIGLPSDLLRRRPDIKKVERELAAATFKVDSAIAALFPRLSLKGFLGDLGALCKGDFASFIQSQLLLPIFNSQLLEQDVELNKIRVQQALCHYEKTVLEALAETENTLASFHSEIAKSKILQKRLAANLQTKKWTEQLYDQGLKNYSEVLAASDSYLALEEESLQNQINLLFDYIILYKCIGGGYEPIFCEESND